MYTSLHRWRGLTAGRLKLVGFSFALAGRRRLPTVPCKLMLFRRVRRLRSESGGPPLFEPSLKIEGDTAHNPKLRLVAPGLMDPQRAGSLKGPPHESALASLRASIFPVTARPAAQTRTSGFLEFAPNRHWEFLRI
jgi:hypothetical protein